MPNWLNYKGLEVPNGAPDDDAGLKLKTDLMALADSAGPVFIAAFDPIANDDSAGSGGHGNFFVFSKWLNTSTNTGFLCLVDTPGLAVWKVTTGLTKDLTNGAYIGGDQSGNARGSSALDVQSNRFAATQVASGAASVCVGYQNTADHFFSTAVGVQNSATSGFDNVAIGFGNSATALQALALGIGNNATLGYDLSLGTYCTASGGAAVAVGQSCVASGGGASALGFNTTASGHYSTASGYYCGASGDYSSAGGSRCHATQDYSTASGNYANATGIGAVAVGTAVTASGNYSCAIGASDVSMTNSTPFSVEVGTFDSQKLRISSNGLEIIGAGASTKASINLSGAMTGGSSALSGSPASLDPSTGTVFTLSSSADITINATAGGNAGQFIFLVVGNTHGSAAVVFTFGTDLKSSGTMTLNHGTTGTILFVSNGIKFYEVCRTLNMTT